MFSGQVSFSDPQVVLTGPGDRWCLKQEKGTLLSSVSRPRKPSHQADFSPCVSLNKIAVIAYA